MRNFREILSEFKTINAKFWNFMTKNWKKLTPKKPDSGDDYINRNVPQVSACKPHAMQEGISQVDLDQYMTAEYGIIKEYARSYTA